MTVLKVIFTVHVFPHVDDWLSTTALLMTADIGPYSIHPCASHSRWTLFHEVQTEERLLFMLSAKLALALEQLDQTDIVRVSGPRPTETPEMLLLPILRLGDQAGLVGYDA